MYNYSSDILLQLINLNNLSDKILSILIFILFFSVSIFMLTLLRWFKR